ncbi:MAG: acyltransferase [Bacteroidota bacterium]
MKKILRKIFLKIVPPFYLQSLLNKEAADKCLEACMAGENSKFYPGAKVENLRLDKSRIKIGNNVHVRGELLVFPYGEGINIGDNCYIGEGTRIWSGESVKIGSNVLISHNCNIIDTDSHELNHLERADSFLQLVTQKKANTDKGNVKTAPVIIDDYAWLSYNVSVLKGVRVGKGAIIGACSLVTEDIPDFCIAAGVPAKVIKKIT